LDIFEILPIPDLHNSIEINFNLIYVWIGVCLYQSNKNNNRKLITLKLDMSLYDLFEKLFDKKNDFYSLKKPVKPLIGKYKVHLN